MWPQISISIFSRFCQEAQTYTVEQLGSSIKDFGLEVHPLGSEYQLRYLKELVTILALPLKLEDQDTVFVGALC